MTGTTFFGYPARDPTCAGGPAVGGPAAAYTGALRAAGAGERYPQVVRGLEGPYEGPDLTCLAPSLPGGFSRAYFQSTLATQYAPVSNGGPYG